ncbi:MAG: hypothetical protein GY892_02630 [Shimia sp.]|jgi:hypothetical protein|nr:hypothetical protein [Shimia sp.]
MALVRAYSDVRKREPDGTFVPFSAARAVGLALELGFKAGRRKGFGALANEDVAVVSVARHLQACDGEGGRWRKAAAARLQLTPSDASFALELLRAMRRFLADSAFNYYGVDLKARRGFWDLLGDFAQPAHGVAGLVGVELKVLTDTRRLQGACAALEAKVVEEGASLSGAMLLAAVCRASGRGWAKPQLFCRLYNRSSQQWHDLGVTPGPPVRQGCSKGPKLPLAKVFKTMAWHGSLRGVSGRAGVLKHFLEALGLNSTCPGQRAATFNKMLEEGGYTGRFVRKALPGGGKPAWVATQTVFSAVCTWV